MRAVSIVTGSSRGLGLAVARALAKRGHRVVFTGRDGAAAQALATEATRAGHEASAMPLDVTSETSVRALAESLRGDRVEVLVNNAGIAMRGFDAKVARSTIETNFYGALRVTDALTPLLTPDARIVMVSSSMGEVSCLSPELQREFLDPTLDGSRLRALVERFVRDVTTGVHEKSGWPSSAYSVSKVALNALTRIVARDLTGARVNAVCPGWVRTDMGGRSAPRTVEEGAESILWAALLGSTGPTGGFFRDGRAVPW